MSENPNTNNFVNMEAPASWNTRYVTPDGFVCQLTLRGETGKDLLDKANAALTWLKDKGYLPSENNSYRSKNTSAKTSNVDANPDKPAPICPIHQVAMKCFQKNGKTWYSHKVDDGWCTGKINGN